jgi:hypothetical protein
VPSKRLRLDLWKALRNKIEEKIRTDANPQLTQFPTFGKSPKQIHEPPTLNHTKAESDCEIESDGWQHNRPVD